MVKVVMVLLVAVLACAVGAKLWYEASSEPVAGPVNEPWSQERMQFVTWNNARWTAWIRNGDFEQLPQNVGKWSRHASPSIAFSDWEGQPWQAKIDGDEFLLARRGDWNGSVEHASAIRYRDWAGRNQLRTVAQLRR